MGHLITLLSPKKIIVQDGFNRADSASLGNADTGQTWQATQAGFGILSNQAQITVNTYGFAYIDARQSNCIISCDFVWRTGDLNILQFRTDGTTANRFGFRLRTADGLTLLKTVANVDTTLATVALTPVDGQTYSLKAIIQGSSVKCYLNNIERISVTEPNLSALTNHGFSMYSNPIAATSRVDNFRVEVL